MSDFQKITKPSPILAKEKSVIVAASGLSKSYGTRAAIKGIDFSIFKGECFGFLGPNGAGKTTTIQIILGLVEKSAGSLDVFGQPVPECLRAIKARIGVVPQTDSLDTDNPLDVPR